MNRGPRILVVDDDDDIRKLVCLVLELEGYLGVPASNGIEALQILRESDRPSLILVDLMMPAMDGEQLVATLNMTRDFASIPLVIMSGHSDARQKSHTLNVRDCLVKPVDVDELLSTVKRLALAS
jgi:CheY-like chemotaxis protein